LEGQDVRRLLQDAEIDPSVLDDPDGRVPSDKVSLLWSKAVESSGNSAIGLAAAKEAEPGGFDVVGYAMMSAPDLRGVLERICRYVRIVSDAASLDMLEEPDAIGVMLSLRSLVRSVPWQRYAYDFMTLCTFCRWVLADQVRPVRLELVVPPDTDLSAHEAIFGCPIRSASRSAIFFSAADAGRSLPTANRVLSQFHESIADEQMKRLGLLGIGARVRGEIIKHLPEGEPRRPAIARAMAMSDRTLQRRLQEEETSFGALLDEARRDLAARYVARPDLSLSEVAYLLGFNNQSSFFRAWKRWFATPPRHFREKRLAPFGK